jgi:methylmalonyl-CoA epimerase
MLIGNLIEVGVAVSDLHGASRTFAKLLRAQVTDTIPAPMFSMEFRMCRLGDVDFELMTPYAAVSPVSRFISRRGEGLHHVAFQVPDICETIAPCRARGLPILSEEPVLLGGVRAAFLHPGCLSGLLVEFVENLHSWGAIQQDGKPEPDIGRITGFGVAVRDVDAAASDYASVLGAEISESCWNERRGAKVRHALVNGIRFELFPSAAAQSDGAKRDGAGQGLHHVCLAVRDPEGFAPIRKRSVVPGHAMTGGAFLTEPIACHGVMFEIHADGPVPVATSTEQAG